MRLIRARRVLLVLSVLRDLKVLLVLLVLSDHRVSLDHKVYPEIRV